MTGMAVAATTAAGAVCASVAWALASLPVPWEARAEAATTAATVGAIGGASALALSASWYGLAPLLIKEQGFPLRAYALRSFVLYTGVLPPVLAAATWATLSVERGDWSLRAAAHEHVPTTYGQIVGSSWIIGAACHAAHHLGFERCAPRTRVAGAMLAGVAQCLMVLGTVRQDWREFGLEDLREERTAISRWRTQSPEQQKVPVSVAIRDAYR